MMERTNAVRSSSGQPDGHADGRAVDVGDVRGHLRPGRLVAQGGRQQRDEEAVGRRVEPPDDAPVDDADAPVAQQHHVAGVHVAVEGAPAHGGEEEGPHHLLHQRRRVVAEVGHLGQVVDGHAVEELHRQHVAARELGVGLGHRHQLQVELVLQPAEVGQRARLVAQVHLLADLHPEAVEQLQGGAGHLVPGLAHQDLEQRLHQVEVGGHHVLDARPQHLDRHLRPSSRRARCTTAMEAVPIGSGSNSAKASLERQPEVVLHPLAHVGERHRRAGVEAGPELVGHLVAEHAGRRGDDLAELHEGAAEVLEALAQGPGQLGRRQRALADVRSWRSAVGVKWIATTLAMVRLRRSSSRRVGSGRRRG